MTQLYVAADGLSTSPTETHRALTALASSGMKFGIKVNLDDVLLNGFAVSLGRLRVYGCPIFVDLKMWNGTRTMVDVVCALIDHNVEFISVYALADSLLPKVITETEDSATKVLGVTVLTHFDNAYCERHFKRTLPETVRHLADTAYRAGCHGIILPGTTLGEVVHIPRLKVVPGVRPEWYSDDRHSEEITPEAAAANGADIVVCGSPIMKASNPVDPMQKILVALDKNQ